MSVSKKILFFVLDGASDRPVDGWTPLQSAGTPNLDKIAEMGISGIMDTIAPGIRPGSDTAHLSLLGYDPYKFYTGRGPFEAAGIGIDVKPGDIAFRCNFATIKDGLIVDRRAGRIRETGELAHSIMEEIDLGLDFIFKESTGHRAALVLRGEDLSPEVTSNDPKHENKPMKEITYESPVGKKTAEVLREFVSQASKILYSHPVNAERIKAGKRPANTILLRGAGMVPDMEDFEERYGLKPAVVAAAGLVIGIGKMCGMEHISVEGTTGGIDSDVVRKVNTAIKSLDDYDFVLVNIKGADEAGHDGEFEAKRDFIGKIDDAFADVSGLEDTLVVVTVDHSTPVSIRDHSADPVPVMMSGHGVRRDDVNSYDEISAAKGGLHRIRGMDLIPILMDLIDRTSKFGA
ncbi:MAG: 2,3-bisphosphoglycerate-independent phosphoglycerate mutase [Halobacteriota archaeon]|nr:2,3-bisphosphoglycerate-independent phosphoglycerate mutase [Halobacteriota archaeon]